MIGVKLMIYKLKEAAKILRVSEKTIKRWAEAGKINIIRTPGNHIMIAADEIQKITGEVPKMEPENE